VAGVWLRPTRAASKTCQSTVAGLSGFLNRRGNQIRHFSAPDWPRCPHPHALVGVLRRFGGKSLQRAINAGDDLGEGAQRFVDRHITQHAPPTQPGAVELLRRLKADFDKRRPASPIRRCRLDIGQRKENRANSIGEAFGGALRPQRPHDRDQPFASMQRRSNSFAFASGISVGAPSAAAPFEASN
jgi:hypothetical protein